MAKNQEPVAVMGAGVLNSGASFYLVSSASEPGMFYAVEQHPTRLTCTCRGYTYRGKCKHVDAVSAHKQAQQLALAERADVLVPTTKPAPRETGSHPGDTAILRRNNQPFSLMA